MSGEAHAAILRFLLEHGYRETQEAFVREAGEHIDFDLVEDSPPVHTVLRSADPVARMTDAMGQLAIEREKELLEGDGVYFTAIEDSLDSVHSTNILAVALQSETGLIATSSTDKTVKLTLNGQNTHTFRHHQSPVLSIEFHPVLSHLVLTTGMDGQAVLIDIRQCSDSSDTQAGVLQRFRDHRKYVVRGTFSSDGLYMATASYDQTVCVYEQQGDQYVLLKQIGPFIGNIETICFIPPTPEPEAPECLVAGVSNDNYLHYIDLPSCEIRRVNMNANNDDWVSFSPAWLSASPDGRYLLCSTNQASGRIILFAAREPKQLQNYYDGPSDNPFVTRRHAWHPSGRYFYSVGGDDCSIRVIETKTARAVSKLVGHKAMIRSMAVSRNKLITAGYDHCVNVWSTPVLQR